MEPEIEIKVVHIQCIKSKQEQDTVYCEMKGKYLNTDSKLERKLPRKGTWSFSQGQSLGPNESVFSGPVDAGVEMEIEFQEQDGAGILNFLDKKIGGLVLVYNRDKTYEWKAHKKTTYEGRQPDGSHQFFLEGSRAEYRVRLALYDKVAV
ncbi:MAG: hypothetical protein KF690_01800 [Bacteroidetes bacterium]|nr:hypothetical protein [Bacteroidota bacterium]